MSSVVVAALASGRATNPMGSKGIHGEDHWKCVALAALRIAAHTPGADYPFLWTFAMLHDLMRENDGMDPEHGYRAAELFVELTSAQDLAGWQERSQRVVDMCWALAQHNTGRHAREYPNPNVGICWDADRVNLWRIGIKPDPDLMSTAYGQTEEASQDGSELVTMQFEETLPSWEEIARQYAVVSSA